MGLLKGIKPRYTDVHGAARYTGFSRAFFNLARHQGRGPAFIRPQGTRKILYDLHELDRWLSKGVHRSTSEYPTPEALREKQSPGRPPKRQPHVKGKRLAGKLKHYII